MQQETQAATGTDDTSPRDLRQQAAERLAAHRQRRARIGKPLERPSVEAEPLSQPHNPIAAAVAERFAHSPSYRAVLAEQAQRSIQQAAAEAEIAARNAQAVAQAQNQLLAELELWNAPQQFTPETAQTIQRSPTQPRPETQGAEASKSRTPVPPAPAAQGTVQPVKQGSSTGLTVRLYHEIGAPAGQSSQAASPTPWQAVPHLQQTEEDTEEFLALDEEIAFRQAPVFESFDIHPTTIPANLLEFPRQLVAPRKARPRLAEGPLFDDNPRSPQLRIFEVEPEHISAAPAPASTMPDWAGIHLDAQPESVARQPGPEASRTSSTETPSLPLVGRYIPIETAPLELRLMAASVDFILVGFAFLIAVGVTAQCIHRIPTGLPAAGVAGATLAIFWPLYELLFFTFADQTPGMRYARIGLCTFSDENPSRSAIRRRIPAQIVALCPLGIGILWALLDDDGLGWHDRISRMYQRAY